MASQSSSVRAQGERLQQDRRGHQFVRESVAVLIRRGPELRVPVRGLAPVPVLLRLLLRDNVPPVVRRAPDSAMYRAA